MWNTTIIHTFPDGSVVERWKDQEIYRIASNSDTLAKYNNLEIRGQKQIDASIQEVYKYIFPSDKPTLKALRYNDGKPQWSLVHFPSLEPMVRVLEYGAKKYEPENWKQPMDKKQILDSAMRHLIRLLEGHETDDESRLPEVGHLMCNLLFYSYHSNLCSSVKNQSPSSVEISKNR